MPPTIALPTIWRMLVREEAVTGTAESWFMARSAADVAQPKRWSGVGDRGRRREVRGSVGERAAEPGGGGAAPDALARISGDVELVEQGVHPAHALGDLGAAARQEAVAAELQQLG